nr:PREDICTED: coiled-coil domain-containing protein 69 isoform X2 [Anolis carolinensis]XP_008103011.1 PREDICTED: coiled-coil domain-containing protein 69 isoform X2 [Anolis carolinensis]|eukprot:XP_008103010.1 PREDICTED: coiled-coil domain-containing protein 69 isoform X2 [Anolis carolinensis]
MGCLGSKMGCCGAWRKEKVKTQDEEIQGSCELIIVKAENVNITPLHKGADKSEVEHNNEITKLQEKECLQEANVTKTESLCQDVKIQVKKNKDLVSKQELSEQYNLLKRKLDERLGELENVHDQERYFLMKSFEKSKSSLQETIDKLSSQVKYFEEKIKRVEESVLSRDYKKHIQDYGSPSQFWEQEIESLHFVIEMKNERIHHLDKKLFNFEKVMLHIDVPVFSGFL